MMLQQHRTLLPFEPSDLVHPGGPITGAVVRCHPPRHLCTRRLSHGRLTPSVPSRFHCALSRPEPLPREPMTATLRLAVSWCAGRRTQRRMRANENSTLQQCLDQCCQLRSRLSDVADLGGRRQVSHRARELAVLAGSGERGRQKGSEHQQRRTLGAALLAPSSMTMAPCIDLDS